MQARSSCPGWRSSLASSRSNRVKASAVEPAKPPTIWPLPSRRTFLALPLTMVWPIDTWPSPAITTWPPLRTDRMVVACQPGDDEFSGEEDMGPVDSALRAQINLGSRWPRARAVAHRCRYSRTVQEQSPKGPSRSDGVAALGYLGSRANVA